MGATIRKPSLKEVQVDVKVKAVSIVELQRYWLVMPASD
jgi:hypothetical protein